MNEDEYRKAVKYKPRCCWNEGGFNIETWQPNKTKLINGYAVRKEKDGRIALVSDYVLTDSIAVRNLARLSTERRLQGWIVRPPDDVKWIAVSL